MKKNDFENEYRIYKEISRQYDAAEEAKDEAGLDEARAKMHSLIDSVEAKGNDYARVFEDYKDARNCGNQYIDLNDNIWDEKVPALIESLRNLGIDHFTYSSTWSSAIETAWLFIENGCTLEGLIQINGTNRNWKTGEYEKNPAYVFSIQ